MSRERGLPISASMTSTSFTDPCVLFHSFIDALLEFCRQGRDVVAALKLLKVLIGHLHLIFLLQLLQFILGDVGTIDSEHLHHNVDMTTIIFLIVIAGSPLRHDEILRRIIAILVNAIDGKVQILTILFPIFPFVGLGLLLVAARNLNLVLFQQMRII